MLEVFRFNAAGGKEKNGELEVVVLVKPGVSNLQHLEGVDAFIGVARQERCGLETANRRSGRRR